MIRDFFFGILLVLFAVVALEGVTINGKHYGPQITHGPGLLLDWEVKR